MYKIEEIWKFGITVTWFSTGRYLEIIPGKEEGVWGDG